MTSKEVKELLQRKRVYQWELAKEIGISSYTLCRWLREELTPERTEIITKALERMTAL